MKTVFYTAASLDGYIADPSHSLDWLFQFGGDEASSFPEFIRDVGAIAMGSHTYEWILKNHIHADPERPEPWPYEQPTWIFSSRALPRIPGADIRFARGGVVPIFAEMREVAAEKNIWVAGGGGLASQFHERGLLDELVVTIAPVLLVEGAPLFTRTVVTPPLEVLEVRPQASGLTEMRFAVRRR